MNQIDSFTIKLVTVVTINLSFCQSYLFRITRFYLSIYSWQYNSIEVSIRLFVSPIRIFFFIYLSPNAPGPTLKLNYIVKCSKIVLLQVKISVIEFSFIGNLHEGPGIVLDYFIWKLRSWDGLSLFSVSPSSLEFSAYRCQVRSRKYFKIS